ncbi:hypothetical protein [Bacteroides graminisolvens]|uniref:hypothetical protein n=1 Tax=Bacteroides graminisolvens TaxID=477666 RepID=UPI0029C8CEB8|nr:hypothetical protein [Bacteroides graminisolvens]
MAGICVSVTTHKQTFNWNSLHRQRFHPSQGKADCGAYRGPIIGFFVVGAMSRCYLDARWCCFKPLCLVLSPRVGSASSFGICLQGRVQ